MVNKNEKKHLRTDHHMEINIQNTQRTTKFKQSTEPKSTPKSFSQ